MIFAENSAINNYFDLFLLYYCIIDYNLHVKTTERTDLSLVSIKEPDEMREERLEKKTFNRIKEENKDIHYFIQYLLHTFSSFIMYHK